MNCCFIGHRKIEDTPELREQLQKILLDLVEGGVVNFLFGDHSAFHDLCYELVTEIKEKYPEIQRIHYRKDYENAGDDMMRFLTVGYEKSICPKGVGSAGKAGYVERNQAMICESDVCVFYYDVNYQPSRRKNSRRDLFDYQPKSGTAAAYAYAMQKKKKVYNLFPKA